MHPVKEQARWVHGFGGVAVPLIVLLDGGFRAFLNVGVEVFSVGRPVDADGDVKRYEQSEEEDAKPINVVTANPSGGSGFIHGSGLPFSHITTPFAIVAVGANPSQTSDAVGTLMTVSLEVLLCLSDVEPSARCSWR